MTQSDSNKGPSINDIRFRGGGVGFQKSESPYIKKAFSIEEKSEIGGRGGVKNDPKNRISFMDGPLLISLTALKAL